LPKKEPLCKPVYVTKKIIDDKMIKKIKNPKESFTSSKNKIKQENELNQEENELIKEENEFIEEENINHNNKIIRKKIIINNILNILPKIPTVLNNDEIHNIINYISNVYLTSKSIDQFYNNVNKSNKITKNNSSYIKLILYLIDNFDSSLPVDIEPPVDKESQIVEKTPLIKQSPNNDNDNTFLIDNSNSPIHNRMMEQANFIR
jgi:hypothetical protein